ncbi:hypothetical protein [Micromonospora sp. NPDC048063]|uniref:hypothetical protein n=2 Tax=unclassified Micromonospora TaxID=2617518 RepID=UPI0037131183
MLRYRTVLLAEALFASALQPSRHPDRQQVRRAIAGELVRRRVAGCVAEVAYEFGEHPEEAAERMRWALRTVADCGDWGYARLAVLRGRVPRGRSSTETLRINFASD